MMKLVLGILLSIVALIGAASAGAKFVLGPAMSDVAHEEATRVMTAHDARHDSIRRDMEGRSRELSRQLEQIYEQVKKDSERIEWLYQHEIDKP